MQPLTNLNDLCGFCGLFKIQNRLRVWVPLAYFSYSSLGPYVFLFCILNSSQNQQ